MPRVTKQLKPYQFKKGQSGNPSGLPKGVRNKATQFKEDLYKAYEKLGGWQGLVDWIKSNKHNRFHLYEFIIKTLPKEIDVKGNIGDTKIIIIRANEKESTGEEREKIYDNNRTTKEE